MQEVRQEKNGGLDMNAPLLDHFSFHRIILDEAHEILCLDFYVGMFIITFLFIQLHLLSLTIMHVNLVILINNIIFIYLFLIETFLGMKYEYLWAVTANPFGGDYAINNLSRLHKMEGINNATVFYSRNLTWQNTKESISKEYPL